jgi:hypothetical protein
MGVKVTESLNKNRDLIFTKSRFSTVYLILIILGHRLWEQSGRTRGHESEVQWYTRTAKDQTSSLGMKETWL